MQYVHKKSVEAIEFLNGFGTAKTHHRCEGCIYPSRNIKNGARIREFMQKYQYLTGGRRARRGDLRVMTSFKGKPAKEALKIVRGFISENFPGLLSAFSVHVKPTKAGAGWHAHILLNPRINLDKVSADSITGTVSKGGVLDLRKADIKKLNSSYDRLVEKHDLNKVGKNISKPKQKRMNKPINKAYPTPSLPSSPSSTYRK